MVVPEKHPEDEREVAYDSKVPVEKEQDRSPLFEAM